MCEKSVSVPSEDFDKYTTLNIENEKLKQQLQECKEQKDKQFWEYVKRCDDVQTHKEKEDKLRNYIKSIDEDEFINTEHYVELLQILDGSENSENN